jgi:hypothetical protein
MMRVWAERHIPSATEGVANRHWKLNKLRVNTPDLGTIFTIVRNPYARLVSQFFWIGQTAQLRIATGYERHTEQSILDDIREVKSYEKGFDRYVRKLYNKEYNEIWFDKWRYETDWTRRDTQASWLSGEKIDCVIKLENINQQFHIIQNLLDCPAPFIDALNPSKHEHFSTYYTQDTRDMVAEMFKDDFETFGYSYDL